MLIAIPSMSRAGKVETLNWLPPRWLDRTTLVVPQDQNYEYRRVHTGLVCPPVDVKGIGPTREWICQMARLTDEKKILMLDDDLDFAIRRFDEPTKFKRATLDEVGRALDDVEELLDSYAMVHISHREGANRCTDNLIFNNRALRALAYRVDVLQEEDIHFFDYKLMEDFGVQLELLTNGYVTCGLNTYVHNQPRSGASGGCSVYRTSSMQHNAAVALEARFPQFVKAVLKKGWGDELYRTDVTVQWKKAFQSSGASPTATLLDRGKGTDQDQEGGGQRPAVVD